MTSVNKTILLASLQNCPPERCMKLAQNPSTQGYYALKARLEASSASWVQRFLGLGGLDALVDTLEALSGRNFTNFSDTVLQLDCLGCIRAVLNTTEGMNSLLNQEDLVRKLIIALDSPNALPKKQIFEVLTVVVVYSFRGHHAVMEALAHFQKICHQTSEYSVVLTELRETDSATYKRTLLAFINALITRHKNLHERHRLRGHLIGLGLLNILESFRRDQQDANLLIQLEVFWDMKGRDEDMLERSHSFDFNAPKEIFAALLDEVAPYPECRQDLLHVLQDLYLLHATRNIDQSLLWSTYSQMSHHVTNMVDETETQHFLRSLEKLNQKETVKPAKKRAREPLKERTVKANKTSAPAPLPKGGDPIDRDSGISLSGNSSFYDNIKHTPKRPLKKLHWTKVPEGQALKSLSIWRQINEGSAGKRKSVLDFSAIELEFFDTEPEIMHADDEVHILFRSDSLKLNLFLSRLETSPDGLADCLLEGDVDDLSVASLRALLKMIPSADTVEQLRQFEGERFELAPAEQFLLKLSDFPEHRLLLEGLLFRKEMAQSVPRLAQVLGALITSTRDIMHHHGLRDFARYVLEAGNFLNTGNSVGQAAGVKLDSLAKIIEVKGQHHHSNLLASIVHQMETKDESILMFVYDFPKLEIAAEAQVTDIRSEINQINNKLKRLLSQLSGAGPKIREMFSGVIEDIKRDIEVLHDNLTQLRSLANQMAQYFCEDPSNFELQKCLLNVLELCLLVRRCQKETPRNLKQYHLAMAKKNALEAQQKDSKEAHVFGGRADACSSFTAPNIESVLDDIVKDISCGKFACHQDSDEVSVALDDQESSLMLSQINTSTPNRGLEDTIDDRCSFAICAVRDKTERKTYVDRVEGVIAQQYHRDQQLSTASYLHAEPEKAKPEDDDDCDDTLKEDDDLKIRFYPKVNEKPGMARRNAWIKRHRRINSDFNHSTRIDDNWEKYQKEATHDKGKAESDNVVMSLGLEKEGRTLLADDMDELEKTLVASDQGQTSEEKPKKRGSFSFFRRFNNLRATLTQRNSNSNKRESRKSKKGRKEKESNKENVIAE